MSQLSKSLLGIFVLATLSFVTIDAAVLKRESKDREPVSADKQPFMVKRGDCELTFGGKAKAEYFLQPRINLLNKNVPDQNEYFKQCIDLTFDVQYGKEKWHHPAIQAFVDLRQKSIWGKATSYADKDSGPIAAAGIKLDDAVVGIHSHTTGKPLIWLKDAWVQGSLNAAFGLHDACVHTVRAGWFTFELGRGIALGSVYGLNKESFGLYSYVEDKSTPGIQIHGDIVKDCLSYDLYFSRFEERSKGFGDTTSIIKRHIVPLAKAGKIWRGLGKEDDVFAARVQWKALKDSDAGTMTVEPYLFYNSALDQKVEIAPDAKSQWGSVGLMTEHKVKGFEYGFDVAMNYGTQTMYNIDRNTIKVQNDGEGRFQQVYSHIVARTGEKVPVTPASKHAAGILTIAQDYTTNLVIPAQAEDKPFNLAAVPADTYFSKVDRFRPAYKNKLAGWMGVADAGYNFDEHKLLVAAGVGFASGDIDPHKEAKDKTYKGFIGLHEAYSGKLVKSVMFLDERQTVRPLSLAKGTKDPKIRQDTSFTDLAMVGLSATWKPVCPIKNLSLNPNFVTFWKASPLYKYDADAKALSTTARASAYLGTELNLFVKATMIQDLSVFAVGAIFVPGRHYTDMKGVPFDGQEFIEQIENDPRNDIEDASHLKLGDDIAGHLNIGLEYRF